MTATDELRRLLDERGVEHRDHNDWATTWLTPDSCQATACEDYAVKDWLRLEVVCITPAQAVEATLGSDLKAENAKLRELVRDMWAALWTCNQYACKHGKDGCYTEDGDNGGKCALRDRMRELGVDA